MFTEFDAPFVLARNMGAALASVMEDDVVVDDAIHDEGSSERFPVECAVPLAVRDIVATGDEMVCGQGLEEIFGEGEWLGFAWANRTYVRRWAVINEPCSIRAGVVLPGKTGGERLIALATDAITDEAAMRLDLFGKGRDELGGLRGRGVDGWLRRHFQRGPCLREGRVGEADIVPRFNDLVLEGDVLESSFCASGDGNGFTGAGLCWGVLNVEEGRGGLRG